MFMLLAANNVWFIVRSGFNQSTMVAYGTCSGSASFCVENVFRETTIMCRMEFEFCALLRHCIVYDHIWDSVTDAQFLGFLAFFFLNLFVFVYLFKKKKIVCWLAFKLLFVISLSPVFFLHLFLCPSSILSWRRAHPPAAHKQPERHRHLSPLQLCRRTRLLQPISHAAVLPFSRLALQQIRPCTAARGHAGQVTLCRQHPKGPQVSRSLRFVSTGV